MTTIFWAGDSTAEQCRLATDLQTSIGQMLSQDLRPQQVSIVDHVRNGRSITAFMDEGCLALIYDRIREGDLLFIQFGSGNEGSEALPRYADPETELPADLERLVNAARNKKAIPVFILPLRRGMQSDAWAKGYRCTAKRLNIALIDPSPVSQQQEGANTHD